MVQSGRVFQARKTLKIAAITMAAGAGAFGRLGTKTPAVGTNHGRGCALAKDRTGMFRPTRYRGLRMVSNR